MYRKSNMETYITIHKIDDKQQEFIVWLRKLKQGLCMNLEGWDEKGDGREVQKRRDICIPMADFFSWQNSISLCSASFRIPRPNLPVTPGVS